MAKRKSKYDYDLLILGSGAGGGVSAHIAGNSKKKVALIEDDTIGGECPNYGCVPTKALLHSAELYHEAKNSKHFGIKIAALSYDYARIKAWKNLAVLRTGTQDGEHTFKSDGIDVIRGHGHFISPHEISVEGKRYTARNFLVATGTKNFIPPIAGLEETGYVTYRDAIDFDEPPKSLFIIGGGAIGCEFAQIFAIFGTKVHVAEASPTLLGKEDVEVGQLVEAVFDKEFGIKVHTSTKVSKIAAEKGKKRVYFEKGSDHSSVLVDEILLATGKLANVDCGLDNAGVKYTQRNIIVDSTMQTSAKHIYAAGDVAGPYMFTHMASYQSRIAAHNIFKRTKVHATYHAVPRCVFVSPEAASVGMTEKEARDKGLNIKIGAVSTSVIGRANTSNKRTGFVKVIATKQGVLIGASIVAPRAGEMIHELALAIHNGLKAEDVEATIHAFPTWSEAVRIACARIS